MSTTSDCSSSTRSSEPATDGPLATAEQMLLHVDTASQRAAPAPEALRARLARIATAHAVLPRPESAGRAIRQLTTSDG